MFSPTKRTCLLLMCEGKQGLLRLEHSSQQDNDLTGNNKQPVNFLREQPFYMVKGLIC
jgi:hypothetical protein